MVIPKQSADLFHFLIPVVLLCTMCHLVGYLCNKVNYFSSPHRYQCPYCENDFAQKTTLKKHVQSKHKESFATTDFTKIVGIKKPSPFKHDFIKNILNEIISDVLTIRDSIHESTAKADTTNDNLGLAFKTEATNMDGLVFKTEPNNVDSNLSIKTEPNIPEDSSSKPESETPNFDKLWANTMASNEARKSIKVKKVFCPMCDNSFTQKHNLRKHVEIKHPDVYR